MRFRQWLRRETHWRNTDEFFTALLFETGAPPTPLTLAYAEGKFVSIIDELNLRPWRNELAAVVNQRTHHSIDPSHVVQEYLKWLYRKQESKAISVR